VKQAFETTYHELEDTHWWFVARREIILRLTRRELSGHQDAKILEIGCSGGPLLRMLSDAGFPNLWGIDISQEAVFLCHERGLDNVLQMDGARTDFPEEDFDLIIASDVLEHIEDDGAAVGEWRRILKTGGSLVCFVPAFTLLWSPHDEENEHYRRYSKRQLESLLRAHDFDTVRSSYWNCLLFTPVLIYRLLARWNGTQRFFGRQLGTTGPHLNALLTAILKAENALLATGVNAPVGISVFAVARK
jgi:SAM-dependent methyltransferase